MKIAVSGKGGVGKTTVSANLAKLFAARGYNVFAVDADPDSSLGYALGINDNELAEIKPVIDMKEIIDERMGGGALYPLNPRLNDAVEEFCINANGIKFLRMGGVKRGGSECYCRENTFLRALVNSLIMDTKDAVVMDMGAGIEHLTRGTSTGVDLMLIVTEPGRSSVQTARIVESLAKDLQVKKVRFIANKIRSDREEAFIRDNFTGDELLGILHFDEDIIERSMGTDIRRLETDNSEMEKVLLRIFGI